MFECMNCGQCCQNVVFHIQERKTAIHHAGYREVNPKIIAQFRHSLEYRLSNHLSERDYYFLEGRCPFFVEEGCLIYLSRPFNCRNFLCGRKDKDEVIEWDGQVCLNQTRRLKKEPEYKEYVTKELEKGRAYARSVGVL